MIPELKRIHSPDIDDLVNYIPETPECFSILIQIMVGPRGEDWEESFDIDVCTPRWIDKNQDKDEVLIARHYLIVIEFNYENIVEAIKKYLMSCSGKNWEEVAVKVGGLGHWEFEGFEE